MARARLGQLTALEGRQVSLALRSGDRIDDAQLVSARRAGALWLFTNGSDRFIAVEDVIAVWEVQPAGPPPAA
jgi:predicted metalloprotease